MKILVDEMPKHPKLCPFAETEFYSWAEYDFNCLIAHCKCNFKERAGTCHGLTEISDEVIPVSYYKK